MRKLFFLAAVTVPASFALDSAAASLIDAVKSPALTAAIAAFDKWFAWIYAALLIITISLSLKRSKGKRPILALLGSITMAVALTYLVKFIVQRARPDGVVLAVPFTDKVDYAFPSSHAAITAAAAATAIVLRQAWIAFAAATIFSRLYLGLHYLSDIVAGVAIAVLAGKFASGRLKEKLAKEDDVELARQAAHLIIGLVLAWAAYKYERAGIVILAIAVAGLMISRLIIKARGWRKTLVRIADSLLERVERKKEIEKFPGKGAIMLFLGAGLAAVLFGKAGAAAIIVLAVGDSASHIAGRLWGRLKHRGIFSANKTVEGSVAGFICSAAVLAFLLPAWTAIAAAGAGMIVEAAKVEVFGKKLDDNISVPLISAVTIIIMASIA